MRPDRCRIPAYIGNSAYCYADCIAMLLASVGEQVTSSTAEVLSGVGIGAFWDKRKDIGFFSNLWTAPPAGITNALTILGFTFKEYNQPSLKNPPLERLKRDLRKTPAIIGPIDLKYLSNPPTGRDAKGNVGQGSDHFVLVYKLSGGGVSIHDPHEYPCVTITIPHFLKAWRAENIIYKQGEYRYWSAPVRRRRPTDAGIRKSAIKLFAGIYRREDPPGITQHDEAIREMAGYIRRNNGPGKLQAHLGKFCFPLAARRALDYSAFFLPFHRRLSRIKERQAQSFGRLTVLSKQEKWADVPAVLEDLAKDEEECRSALCKIRSVP